MKEKMMLVGVNMGRRFKKKEKELFLQQTIAHCEENGLNTSFQTKKSALMTVCNLVVGDLKSAKTIVACAYDTPAKAVLPSMKYYPFNPSFNTKEEMNNLILQMLGAACCFLCIFFGVKNFRQVQLAMKVLIALYVLVFGYLCFRFLRPSGNLVNFSRNSASVAAMYKMIETVKNPKVAYVFLDQNCASYEGAKLLKEHVTDSQRVLLLDNLASGPKTVVAHRKNVDASSLMSEGWIDKEYEETSNLLSYFKKSIMISCGCIHHQKFYVENTGTKHDYEVDMERLNLIVEKCVHFLEEKE